MTEPSADIDDVLLAVELVAGSAPPTERWLDSLLLLAVERSPAHVTFFERTATHNRVVVHLTADPALLEVPKYVAGLLDADHRVTMALHVGDEASLMTLLAAPELAEALSAPVAVLASQAFIDRTAITAPAGYERIVVATRFEDIPAWLGSATASSAILSLVITPDGRQVVTGHDDGTVRRWDISTGLPIGQPLTEHTGEVNAVAVAGAQIISGGQDGTVRFWRAATGEPLSVTIPRNPIRALAVDPRGRFAVSVASDGRTTGWDLTTRQQEWTFGSRNVLALACGDDEILFVAGIDGIGRWQLIDGVPRLAPAGHQDPVNALATTPNGRLLVSGGADRTIRTWRPTGAELRIINADTAITAIAITPEGRRIISGHPHAGIYRWDADTGRPIGSPLVTNSVNALAVTPDGRQIVAGGEDGVLRRWDLETGEPIAGVVPSHERLADVVSDLESAEDALGVSGDVYTIATVLAALSTKPPLSVALLGNWGAGKSSFMRQVRDRMELLSRSSAQVGDRDAFAGNLRQVTFNAWHYSDDHLWVGLIEHLFRELAAEPATPDPGRVTELKAQLASEGAERDRLAHDLDAVQRIDARGGWLAPLRSWAVLRAAGRELLRGGWRFWVGIAVLLVGIAVVVMGQRVLGIAVGVLGPAVAVWSQVGRYVESARAQLLARKVQLDNEIRATTEELDELDPARRLDRLLAEITEEDRYAGFRGLTGRIHHDLRRLSADLATARRKWERDGRLGTPPLQRIVLYVDDLDRCTPGRVVDVLQAVNLLLTMDLFMVVAAVDPQWLLRSLGAHHGELLTETARVGPVAYLDKIFHIPFALRPMGNHAVEFLRSLLPAEQVIEVASPAAEVLKWREVVAPPLEHVPAIVDKSVVAPVVAAPTVTIAGLRVTAAERDFLSRLTPLLGTPRAIKKLTNLYRLLRLSVPRDALPDFLDGPYQAAALLLTALAGTPHEARALLATLIETPADGDVVDVLKSADPTLGARLGELILAIRKDIRVHDDTATYRRWATEVARFGFETYDLYTG